MTRLEGAAIVTGAGAGIGGGPRGAYLNHRRVVPSRTCNTSRATVKFSGEFVAMSPRHPAFDQQSKGLSTLP